MKERIGDVLIIAGWLLLVAGLVTSIVHWPSRPLFAACVACWGVAVPIAAGVIAGKKAT